MSEPGSGPQRVRFEGCELDLQSGELWKNGERLVLPEQPLRILSVLLRHAGTVVTRDNLRRELWPEDTFVDFEHSLNAAVKRLREALSDSATAPRFIETIPRRGYRFIAAVEVNGEGKSPVVAEPAAAVLQARRGVGAQWIAACVATFLVIVAASRAGYRSSAAILASDVPSKSGLVRLTSTSGLNTGPALSPDGTLLAYASDRSGASGFDIWVQRVGGGDPLQISHASGDETEPSFSPDGAHIVYSAPDSG